MDSNALVTSLFSSGSRLIGALDRVGSRVLVAAWVKTIQEQRWILYLVSKDLEDKGLVLGYRTLSDTLRSIKNNVISISDVKLIGNDTKITRDLLEAQAHYPVTEPQVSKLTNLGNDPIEIAYVYPSARPDLARSTKAVLKFVLKTTENPMQVFSRLRPSGETLLNSSKWQGKEPRSCCIGSINSRPHALNSCGPTVFDIEVEYKPKGFISYTGETRYDGWTALILNRDKDGTLLDGQGGRLPDGHSPVYLERELYKDTDFNELDFGDFVGEVEVERIKQFSYDTVVNAIVSSSNIKSSNISTFTAPRKNRPAVKIVLSENPTSVAYDGFGVQIHYISESTPQLQQVILDKLSELLKSFFEGRSSLKTLSNKDLVFVYLDDLLVDNRPMVRESGPRYNCLGDYINDTHLFDIAMKLTQTYEVDVSVVGGPDFGFLLANKKNEYD